MTLDLVGKIDEAFFSRVHVQLYYPNLLREQQYLVWENVFAALDHEREDMSIDPSALECAKTASMVPGAPGRVWNTRDIQNGDCESS